MRQFRVRCGGRCQEEDGPAGALARLHHRPQVGHRGRQEVEGAARHWEVQDEVFHPPRGEGGSEGALSDDLKEHYFCLCMLKYLI